MNHENLRKKFFEECTERKIEDYFNHVNRTPLFVWKWIEENCLNDLTMEIQELSEFIKAHNDLPDRCIHGYSDSKFCEDRNACADCLLK